MDEILKRDQNHVTVLAGVTDDSDQDITMLRVDPISKRLLIKANFSGSVVTSLNGLTGDITLAAGSNITITPSGNNLTIASTGGGGGSPGGSDTNIQVNDSGSFYGDANLTFDKITGFTTMGGAVNPFYGGPLGPLTITGPRMVTTLPWFTHDTSGAELLTFHATGEAGPEFSGFRIRPLSGTPNDLELFAGRLYFNAFQLFFLTNQLIQTVGFTGDSANPITITDGTFSFVVQNNSYPGALITDVANSAVLTWDSAEPVKINPYNASTVGLQINSRSGQTANPFQINSFSGSDGDLLNVNAIGNVGIGTTTPTHTLEVNGNGTYSEQLGVGNNSPQAQLHVSAIPNPGNFTASAQVGGSSGYSFGSGDKTYAIYAEDSTKPMFSVDSTINFVEPLSTDFDPTSANAIVNYSETGYIAIDNNFIYTIWAIYASGSQLSLGTAVSGNVNDSNDGSGYAVDVSWSAPIGQVPDNYLVQLSGSNPNSGSYRVISGTGFTDDNTSWTTSGSYSPLVYQVQLQWTENSNLADSFLLNNVTDTAYQTGISASPFLDNNTLTPGIPTVTPMSESKTAIFDGPFMDIDGLSYMWPSVQNAGFMTNDGTGTLAFRTIIPTDLSGFTANQVLYGSGSGGIAQSGNLTFDGSLMTLQAGFALTQTNDNSTSGTVNNYSTAGKSTFRFSNNITFTGFADGTSGRSLWILTGNATTITIKNNNAGSIAANRIFTNTGGDIVIGQNSIGQLFYDGGQAMWQVVSIGKPDVTLLSNTWSSLQTFGNNISIGGKQFNISALTSGDLIRYNGTNWINTASLGVTNGGTGNIIYAVGDLLYASGTTTLSKLADVATGNALISGGVTTAPSWGKIGLTTHVSGTLPVANGGTGASTLVGAGIVGVVTNVQLTNQSADIGSTNFSNTSTAGLYRISYSLEDTTSDITAGAVTLTIAYTATAGAITIPSTAQILTGVGLTQGTIFVQLASGSISYSTTHTGLFGTAKYALYMTAERLV